VVALFRIADALKLLSALLFHHTPPRGLMRMPSHTTGSPYNDLTGKTTVFLPCLFPQSIDSNKMVLKIDFYYTAAENVKKRHPG
jgi:hypothetical protein